MLTESFLEHLVRLRRCFRAVEAEDPRFPLERRFTSSSSSSSRLTTESNQNEIQRFLMKFDVVWLAN